MGEIPRPSRPQQGSHCDKFRIRDETSLEITVIPELMHSAYLWAYPNNFLGRKTLSPSIWASHSAFCPWEYSTAKKSQEIFIPGNKLPYKCETNLPINVKQI
jgi:hypothetical protein